MTHLLPFLTFAVIQNEQWDFEPGQGRKVAPTDRPAVLVGVFVRTPSSSLRLAAFWPEDIDPLVLSHHISALEIEESYDGLVKALVTLAAWLDTHKPVVRCPLADLMAWPAKWLEVMGTWHSARPIPNRPEFDTKEKREHRTALVRLTSRLPVSA